MIPAIYNDFIWWQGVNNDFYLVFKDKDGTMVDMAGHTALMQLRSDYGTEYPVIIELSTENGKLINEVIDLAQWETTDTTADNYIKPTDVGKYLLRIHLVPADTESLTVSQAIYDLKIIAPGGYRARPIMGVIVISKEVSR